MSIVAAMCVCVWSCSSDDPTPEPNPDPKPHPDPKENGEVTFDIKLPVGNGNGTATSPAVVNKGEVLDMAISQKSIYTDPDGTVFTCEPTAKIVLAAKLDTVFAKDLAQLINVKEGSDVRSTTSGTAPVCAQTVQTFTIGEQNIVFDLSHEIYTYVNSAKEKIEMPYIKLNQAKLGNSGATEEKTDSRAAASIANVTITVRPLAMSRATTLRDSTMYEVNAQFNLDIESVNAKTDTTQTLVFAVNYIGVVETITELKDPVGTVTYEWDIKSGTVSKASPFVKTAGETMEIWMDQKSTYTDAYSNGADGNPKAKIKLSVAKDTVWSENVEIFKVLTEKTSGNEDTQFATQEFVSDLQTISLEWSYEIGTASLLGETIPMPYYSLQKASLKDISVKSLGNKVVSGKETELYEISVTFSQTANAENVTTKVPAEVLEYVATFIGAVRVKSEPISSLSYVWDIKSGTASKVSPFVKAIGEPMELWMLQKSSYTDAYGTEAKANPTAKIKLSVAKDTIWSESPDIFKVLDEQPIKNSEETSATQVYASDLQNIFIEWSYETAEAELDDAKVPMPYYSLEKAKLKDVTMKPLGGQVIGDKEADLYEITATFRQKAIPVNVASDTPAEEFEYVVSFTGAVEIKLVNVEYIPSGKWEEAHDNLPLGYYAQVIRRRTYSNGIVQEDPFFDLGHGAFFSNHMAYNDGKHYVSDEDYTIVYPASIPVSENGYFEYTQSREFSRAQSFDVEDYREGYNIALDDWSKFSISKLYSGEGLDIAKDFVTSHQPDTRQPGWYFKQFSYSGGKGLVWKVNEDITFHRQGIYLQFIFNDQFLVIDGKRIDFTSLHNREVNMTFDARDFSDETKEGKILTLKCDATYFGRDFHAIRIDTLFVSKTK
ncbi:MAG: hypothetical protein NC218_12065 [Acetobacter sp.]|nr:hypothetical protein [Acetobacter sp.]